MINFGYFENTGYTSDKNFCNATLLQKKCGV